MGFLNISTLIIEKVFNFLKIMLKPRFGILKLSYKLYHAATFCHIFFISSITGFISHYLTINWSVHFFL